MTHAGAADAGSGPGLGRARAGRWWVRGRRVGSISRAAAFVDDVGFALLFPTPKLPAPSLWEAVAGEDSEPFAAGMGANEQKVWAWKDELPGRGLAWYGTFVAGRGSFLSPGLLAALYPGAGEVDDHESLPLSPTAHEIARLLAGEPLPSAVLRTLIGDRNRYQRAVVELQRQLLITTAGVQTHRTGWPSALVELTCRRFDVSGGYDHSLAAWRFLDTMLLATPADLARAFRWPVTQARARLDELCSTGRATSDGARYLKVPSATPYANRHDGRGVSMHGEPAFFEIGVPDAKRAKAFYGQLFKWTFHPMGGDQAWVETPTVRGGLHDEDPESRIDIFFAVPDIDTAVLAVRELGGHADDPRPEEPGFGRFVFCRDDQGVRFGLHQPPAT